MGTMIRTTLQARTSAAAHFNGPLMEDLHRNIAFANAYRMELIKFLMAVSTALLAFTVTFRPALDRVDWTWAMWASWGGLALSLIGGMVHMLGWDHFYKSYRDVDYRASQSVTRTEARKLGKAARKTINLWRRAGMWSQFVGFAVGVAGVAAFAVVNIDNVHKADTAARPSQAGNAGAQPPQAGAIPASAPTNKAPNDKN